MTTKQRDALVEMLRERNWTLHRVVSDVTDGELSAGEVGVLRHDGEDIMLVAQSDTEKTFCTVAEDDNGDLIVSPQPVDTTLCAYLDTILQQVPDSYVQNQAYRI